MIVRYLAATSLPPTLETCIQEPVLHIPAPPGERIGKVAARYPAVTPGVAVRCLAVTRGVTVRYLTVTASPPPRYQRNPGHPLGQVHTLDYKPLLCEKMNSGIPRRYHAATPDVTAKNITAPRRPPLLPR